MLDEKSNHAKYSKHESETVGERQSCGIVHFIGRHNLTSPLRGLYPCVFFSYLKSALLGRQSKVYCDIKSQRIAVDGVLVGFPERYGLCPEENRLINLTSAFEVQSEYPRTS